MKTSLPHKQKGAAAIEFALVFIIFFGVFYGIVSYSVPLLLMQSFNQSTAEAVRSSVALDPTTPGYPAAIVALAKSVLTTQTQWIPAALNFNVATDAVVTYDPAGKLLKVTINYSTNKIAAVIPFLTLPGIGQVPNLPATLSATSSLQF